MKIALEVLPTLGKKVGAGYYAEHIIRGLAGIDKENEYLLYGNFWRNYRRKITEIFYPKQANFTLKIYRFPNRLLEICEKKMNIPWQYWMLRREKVDIIHGLVNLVPYLPANKKDIKTVLTIHDLSFEVNPEWYSSDWYKGVRASAEQADRIITVSESTKTDLIKYYHIQPEKITVIYNAYDQVFKVSPDPNLLNSVRERYHLPAKFIIFVGGIRPLKNLPRIIKAFALAKSKKRIDGKLVIVGRKVHPSEEVDRMIDTLSLQNEVILTGYVPREDLVGLYKLASFFIFSTLYEGFGIPVLEAMACGTPVITSDISSLPEISGGAALLVDPYNVPAIAEAMEQLFSDSCLRQSLITRGLERVKQFSWEETARKTWQVYQKVFTGKKN